MAYDKNATPLSEASQIQLANEINRIDEWLNSDENKPNEIRHAGNAAYMTASYSLSLQLENMVLRLGLYFPHNAGNTARPSALTVKNHE